MGLAAYVSDAPHSWNIQLQWWCSIYEPASTWIAAFCAGNNGMIHRCSQPWLTVTHGWGAKDATAGLETVPVLNGIIWASALLPTDREGTAERPVSGKVLIPHPPVATHKLARTYHYISCVNYFPIYCWGRAQHILETCYPQRLRSVGRSSRLDILTTKPCNFRFYLLAAGRAGAYAAIHKPLDFAQWLPA